MSPTLRILLVLAALSAVAGCRGETSKSSQFFPFRNMFDQQRYDPQQESTFYRDGMTMRQPPAHTFAREMELEMHIAEGRLPDDSGYVMAIPGEVTKRLGGGEAQVARGQDRFNIYCRPCHDGTGAGNGLAVQRGMAQPPTLHDDKMRTMPDGQLFAVMSNGIRNMPPYKHSIPTDDRWAIVAYVRALQLSQAGAKE